MYRINSDKTLATAIQNLEAQRVLELEILKKHAEYTFHELNPLNIVKEKIHDGLSNISETVHSTGFKNGVLKTGIGLATGFLTKKLFLGADAGIVKRLLGTAVQAAVSGFIIKKLPDESSEINT
ncbi:hypothetical protein [Flavobacterium tegetincola]|uniref:hypothetical protein n=1 Tax=Flavobacterium tegetincola TaxID=150172 RepID=UPI000408BF0B|nr:hypothetical protein [Flavobacterium tegetincola]